MKRNHVKLHDMVLKLIQDREEDKKQNDIQFKVIMDMREQLQLLVNLSFINHKPHLSFLNEFHYLFL